MTRGAGSLRPVLLDTSVVVAVWRRDKPVLTHLASVQGVVTAIVIGELYYGAFSAAHPAQQLSYIAGLIATNTVLYCDQHTGEQYGRIKLALRRQGAMIPDNDL